MKNSIICLLILIFPILGNGQENIAPEAQIIGYSNFINPENAIDNNYNNTTRLTSGDDTGYLEIHWDEPRLLTDIIVVFNEVSGNDEITISYTNGGGYSQLGTYNYSDFPVTLNQTATDIKVEVDKYSASTLVDIREVEIYGPIPVIKFSYDDAGNRESRSLEFVLTKSGKASIDEQKPSEKITLEGTIKIYPNPTSGKLTVNLEDLEIIGDGKIDVFDMRGALIRQHKNINATTVIDLSDQPSGNYVMRIYVNGNYHDWKIIKE